MRAINFLGLLLIFVLISGCAPKVSTLLSPSTLVECEAIQGNGKIRWSEGGSFNMTFLTDKAGEIQLHVHDLLGRRAFSLGFKERHLILLDHRESLFTWIPQDELCFDERFCFIDTQLGQFLAGTSTSDSLSQNPLCTQQEATIYRCGSESHWIRLTVRERSCFRESIPPLEIPGGYRERPLHRTQLR